MKKFLKLLTVPAAMVLLAGSVTSCAPTQKEIAMISDVGDVDDGSFNQGCWEAVQKYGTENGKSYDYYRPFNDSYFARECAVKQAVTKGAKVILMPGFKFSLQNFALNMANKYPDVHFMLLDSSNDKADNNNLICVNYNFACSGWLAGYGVAYDYLTTDWNTNGKLEDEYKFGFCGGMANGGVYPYGFGYVQGILYAFDEFVKDRTHYGVTNPKVTFDYNYAGVFAQDDGACARVKGWYGAGTKCVFACGGKLFQSVTEAVKEYNRHNGYANFEDQKAPRGAARWVGVDADQYTLLQDKDEVKSIYTSALKDVGETVRVGLNHHFNNVWGDLQKINGVNVGHSVTVGLKTTFGNKKYCTPEYNYSGLPMVTKADGKTLRSFNCFTLDNYNDKVTKIVNGSKETHGEDDIEIYNGYSKEYGEKEGFPQFIGKRKYPEKGSVARSYYNGGKGYYDTLITMNIIE